MFMYIAMRVKCLTLTVMCVSVHPQSQNESIFLSQHIVSFFFSVLSTRFAATMCGLSGKYHVKDCMVCFQMFTCLKITIVRIHYHYKPKEGIPVCA